jgi:hypothetical protein
MIGLLMKTLTKAKNHKSEIKKLPPTAMPRAVQISID